MFVLSLESIFCVYVVLACVRITVQSLSNGKHILMRHIPQYEKQVFCLVDRDESLLSHFILYFSLLSLIS